MAKCLAIEALIQNMRDVDRLLRIHKDITGSKKGRRWGVEVLNRSAVVLITAAWEAFVEDLAEESFNFLLKQAKFATKIPRKVIAIACNPLIEDPDETKVWQLADSGWRKVLLSHKDALFRKHTRTFNTPKPENIDALFEDLVGLRHFSRQWYWRNMPVDKACINLMNYVRDRGAIAHRTRTKKSITKDYVRAYRIFVYRLSVKSTNAVRNYLEKVVGRYPWNRYHIGSVE